MLEKADYAKRNASIMGLSLFVLWVFVCSINFSLFSGYYAEGYHAPPVSFPATTPRATTPHRYLTATTPRATTPVQIHSS